MYPFNNNAPPAARPNLHPPIPYPHPAPVIPYHHASHAFDEKMNSEYSDSFDRLRKAVSHTPFPNPSAKQECQNFLKHLRIHRHLFMHVYVHLVSCCNSRDLDLLVGNVSVWTQSSDVQQLARHSLIRNELINLLRRDPCHRHESLLDRVISDDDRDLLCHLLLCRRKSELYRLRGRGPDAQESNQIIELIWQFLKKDLPTEIACRLRAQIYRMTRKSAYLPRDLWIERHVVYNEQRLGKGAHGLVTRAIVNGTHVAIKRISCTDAADRGRCLEMFAGEAILWKTLKHKSIVPFLGVVTAGTFDIGLVSQFFGNGSIRSYVNGFQYSTSLGRRWARDLAEGLEYIHRQVPPIIHGDLKGDNVLIDDDGHARLGDFGQSHASDSGKHLDSTRVGSPEFNAVHWMAPEIMSGGDRAKTTTECDIYSFGCVLYEVMSGKIPFEGRSLGDVVEDVKKGNRPQRPRSISENDPLWKTAKWCWAQHPARRPSAAQLVSCLL